MTALLKKLLTACAFILGGLKSQLGMSVIKIAHFQVITTLCEIWAKLPVMSYFMDYSIDSLSDVVYVNISVRNKSYLCRVTMVHLFSEILDIII